MGEQTNIGWTEATWNPWHGCHKVSPGCKNCYMFRDKERYGQNPNVVVRSKTKFKDPLKWSEPKMVFTCSWSDWFIEEADPWRAEAWDIIRATPQHTYQILTKRPERMAEHLPPDWDRQDRWRHVWLGVSVENQAEADRRIPLLLETPAAVRWLSVEPLLGPVDLTRIPTTGEPTAEGHAPSHLDVLSKVLWTNWQYGYPAKAGVNWVVVGGESGPDFRALDLNALKKIVADCRAAGVPVFVKQDSGARPGLQGRIPNEYWLKEFPQPTGA